MKNKAIFLNAIFIVAILFAMLFPSFHATQHLKEVAAHNSCEHKHTNKHEITHQHDSLHDCFACGFTLNFTQIFDFQYHVFDVCNNYKSSISNKLSFVVPFFKGSLFLLRGPPTA